MPLHFEFRSPTADVAALPVEVQGIVPDQLAEKSLAEIERLEILQGNRKIPLAELFRVRGTAGDLRHEWSGDLTTVHWLGTRLKAGRIDVQGNVGRHVGSQQRGGEIHVAGDASDWAGAEMRGGLLHIRGRGGDLVGAAYRGSPRGMTGGMLIVGGSAGDEVGHSQRRGLIYIAGNIGDLAGINLLAGTILVGGQPGVRHGAGMRRGTIAFLGSRPALLPTFRRGCVVRPSFFGLLERHLRQVQAPLAEQTMSGPFELHHGDLLEGGRGEILVRAD